MLIIGTLQCSMYKLLNIIEKSGSRNRTVIYCNAILLLLIAVVQGVIAPPPPPPPDPYWPADQKAQ